MKRPPLRERLTAATQLLRPRPLPRRTAAATTAALAATVALAGILALANPASIGLTPSGLFTIYLLWALPLVAAWWAAPLVGRWTAAAAAGVLWGGAAVALARFTDACGTGAIPAPCSWADAALFGGVLALIPPLGFASIVPLRLSWRAVRQLREQREGKTP